MLVPVADRDLAVTAAVAMADPLPDSSRQAGYSWQLPVGLGLLTAAAAGWSWGQAKAKQKKQQEFRTAAEALFAEDKLDGWLADSARPLEPLWQQRRPLKQLACP